MSMKSLETLELCWLSKASQKKESLLSKRIALNVVTIKLIGGSDSYVLLTRAKYDSFDVRSVVTRGANMTSCSDYSCDEAKGLYGCNRDPRDSVEYVS